MAPKTPSSSIFADPLIEQLNQSTGYPLWRDGKDIAEARSQRYDDERVRSHNLALILPESFDNPWASMKVWIEKQGLNDDENNGRVVFSSQRSDNSVLSAPEPYYFLIEADEKEDLERTAHQFIEHVDTLPSLESYFLASHTPSFMEWLRPMLAADEAATIDKVQLPSNTLRLETWLQTLQKQSVMQKAQKSAKQAGAVLDIIRTHVPALSEYIGTLQQDRNLPAVIGDNAQESWLTDRMDISKNGLKKIVVQRGKGSGDSLIAEVSCYDVSFDCHNATDAKELRLHIMQALEQIAKTPEEFRTESDYDRPAIDSRFGHLRNAYVTIEDDHRITIQPPLDLDDLWLLYEHLSDVIKPTLETAQAMDGARRSEYRSALMQREGARYGAELLFEEDLRRGANASIGPENEQFDAMMADIAGMLAVGDATAEEATSQLIALAWQTLHGDVKTPDDSFPPVLNQLTHLTTDVADQDIPHLINERTQALAQELQIMMGVEPSDIETDMPAKDQLAQANEKLGEQVDRYDAEKLRERLHQIPVKRQARMDIEDAEVDALMDTHPELTRREARARVILGGGAHLELSDLLARAQGRTLSEDAETQQGLSMREGALVRAEGEAPLVERHYRVYPDGYWGDEDDEKITYTSRAGALSLQPPRKELPQALQEVLDKAAAEGKGANNPTTAVLTDGTFVEGEKVGNEKDGGRDVS